MGTRNRFSVARCCCGGITPGEPCEICDSATAPTQFLCEYPAVPDGILGCPFESNSYLATQGLSTCDWLGLYQVGSTWIQAYFFVRRISPNISAFLRGVIGNGVHTNYLLWDYHESDPGGTNLFDCSQPFTLSFVGAYGTSIGAYCDVSGGGIGDAVVTPQ